MFEFTHVVIRSVLIGRKGSFIDVIRSVSSRITNPVAKSLGKLWTSPNTYIAVSRPVPCYTQLERHWILVNHIRHYHTGDVTSCGSSSRRTVRRTSSLAHGRGMESPWCESRSQAPNRFEGIDVTWPQKSIIQIVRGSVPSVWRPDASFNLP